ncbi:MAG TPA: magnesium transporter [Thermoanaerobaculia bacterium]|nr:magnesium transporter [Thermoanaerobaculia bacterium]
MPGETPPASAAGRAETAFEHASLQVPVVAPSSSAGELRAWLAGRSFECVSHLAVCEHERFVGLLRIEDLLAAPESATARELMDADPPVVAPGLDQEVVAWKAVRHRESALAVVDGEGRFHGLIPPHRLLEVLLSEHEEDLTRLGGFLKSTEEARATSEEPVPRRFRHRLPWLLVGLAGALVAADLVGSFESQLADQVMLAFFIPGIVYLADAVGTQTETVVVRGLSVGVSVRRMLRRELLAGLAIGLALAAAAFPLLLWRWGETDLALGVSLALFAACSTATIAAMALPALLDALHLDPAFGAGPLATVIQDLLSILIYFAIVTAVVR